MFLISLCNAKSSPFMILCVWSVKRIALLFSIIIIRHHFFSVFVLHRLLFHNYEIHHPFWYCLHIFIIQTRIWFFLFYIHLFLLFLLLNTKIGIFIWLELIIKLPLIICVVRNENNPLKCSLCMLAYTSYSYMNIWIKNVFFISSFRIKCSLKW